MANGRITAPGGPNVGRPQGIMAPITPTKLSTNITAGETITIRQGESIKFFVAKTRRGNAPDRIEGLAPRSAFTVTEIDRPANSPSAPGQWYQVTAKPDARAGRYHNVFVYGPPQPNDASTIVRFKLVVGPRVVY